MNARIFLMTLLAAVAGQVALIFFRMIAQEILVDGLWWEASTTFDLVIGSLATLLSGLLAGMVASAIGGSGNPWPHALMSLMIGLEALNVSGAGVSNAPVWFSVIYTIALVLAVWQGFRTYQLIRG